MRRRHWARRRRPASGFRSSSTGLRCRMAALSQRLTVSRSRSRRTEPFTLEVETIVDPSANTQLSGLYRSSGTIARNAKQKFPRITYFPDRPTSWPSQPTRIEADKTEAPRPARKWQPGRGRRRARAVGILRSGTIRIPNRLIYCSCGWRPCRCRRPVITMSGRNVTLRIYVEHARRALQLRNGFAQASHAVG